ncbi:MAG: D-tyrosyl-tRNA(Tyr) deacylase [Epulopiscium sp.]|nr:D-tyrosyl-tRNA(Tyr) deacylase [Candidatus Epulonipiscium sp.]
MRAVIQKVAHASVKVDGNIIGEIGKGLLVLLGMQESDDEKVMDYMMDKIIHLRIFEDEEGKMNLSLKDVGGELLIVPNFTLYGDARKGKRPSYSNAAPPAVAEQIYNRFIEKAKATGIKVEQGKFQSHMEVNLLNDGPVTILMDSDKNF